jgi:hypothetical protein
MPLLKCRYLRRQQYGRRISRREMLAYQGGGLPFYLVAEKEMAPWLYDAGNERAQDLHDRSGSALKFGINHFYFSNLVTFIDRQLRRVAS